MRNHRVLRSSPPSGFPATILPVAIVGVLLLLAVGCGSVSVEVGSTTTSANPPTTTAGTDGVGLDGVAADQVVFAVERGGGFQMLEASLREYPQLVIFADGRMVRPGVQPLAFPGPALPSIEVVQLPVGDVEALLAQAADSGLFADGVDFGMPNVADAGSTSVTAWVDGELRTVSAEALGIGPGSDLKAPAIEARADLTALIDSAGNGPAIGAGDAYAPERWLVYSTEFVAQDGLAAGPVATWPLGGDVFDKGADNFIWCADLTVEEAHPAIEAAARATELSEWIVDGESRTVLFTPRFAHQPGCAG